MTFEIIQSNQIQADQYYQQEAVYKKKIRKSYQTVFEKIVKK